MGPGFHQRTEHREGIDMTCPSCGHKLETVRVDEIGEVVTRERHCTFCPLRLRTHERIVMRWRVPVQTKKPARKRL